MGKTKPVLLFVPSHHDLGEEGIFCTPEMLDRESWPIVNYKEEKIEEAWQKVYKDALCALTEIDPFFAKISLEVNLEKKYFMLPKRVWGVIYLEDAIVQFSHDTRLDNAAFKFLEQWPELTNWPSQENYEGEEAEGKKVLEWSSVKNWKKLFRDRIKKAGDEALTKAKNQMNKALEEITDAQSILNAL